MKTLILIPRHTVEYYSEISVNGKVYDCIVN